MPVPVSIDARNTNSLWSSVLVETLVRGGVRQVVVSPGSRSTPLAIAFARHPRLEAIPVLDERSAGFFALGIAKQRMRPVVLVCTSGTAAANYFPAGIEAHESGVPLIVLTADRPPELRACASGQTIDQQKLFGDYVHFQHELALPELNVGLFRYLRQTVAHALLRAAAGAPGPVHLNVPFRDPLAPLPDGGAAEAFSAGTNWNDFFSQLETVSAITPHAVHPVLSPEVHGLIVVGAAQPWDVEEFVDTVGEIARRLGWPVLAEALSPLRNHGPKVPNLVTTYDLILRNDAAAERLKPEIVLCIGGWPTSKVLREWLVESDAPIWLVTERPDNRDGLHGRTHAVAMTLPALAESLSRALADNGYERLWAHYESQARTALDARLEAETTLWEPKVSWLLGRQLPAETSLFVANSMPARDIDYVWPAGDRAIRPLCNRGANGIDGTLSTALGIAHGAAKPAVLLTGDLALLHDTNGFLLRAKFRGSLTIILINNHGGGIFEHLPVSQFEPPFEAFFATPQEANFSQLAIAYGVEYVLVRDWAELEHLIHVLPESGMRLLEIRTDRKLDAAMRKQVFGQISASLA